MKSLTNKARKSGRLETQVIINVLAKVQRQCRDGILSSLGILSLFSVKVPKYPRE
jgi:hypothetical protein